MDTTNIGDPGALSLAIGRHLRRTRRANRWSLQAVQAATGGRWKAARLGSYERGERAINATTLIELVQWYGESPVLFVAQVLDDLTDERAA